MTSKFWPANAIILGVWETLAVTTGRVPTISSAVASCQRRNAKVTTLAVTAWSLGLWRHLILGWLD